MVVEDCEEYERWLDKMNRDAKIKLGMSDESIAYILLREATAYYFKTLGRCGRCTRGVG